MAGRRTIGTVIPTANRFRARYERNNLRHTAGRTFSTEEAAWNWLRSEQTLIDKGEWTPPAQRRAADDAARAQEVAESVPFREYALRWIEGREIGGQTLAPRTRSEYRRYVEGILAEFATTPMSRITADAVRGWWGSHAGVPRLRHHAYAFAKSVLKTAVKDGTIEENVFDIDGAARVSLKTPKGVRASLVNNLEPEQVAALADAMVPRQWRALVLVLAWTGLRPGEAVGLQRRDIHASDNDGRPCWRLSVQRAVSYGRDVDGRRVDTLDRPKTPESIRDVWLPPFVAIELDTHINQFVGAGAEAMLFPSTNPTRKYASSHQIAGKARDDRRGPARGWLGAREAVGLPGLRLYDLRHWARRMLLTAGLGEIAVELYMGHKLPTVQGAYSHTDPRQVWKAMLRLEELAGLAPPPSPAPAPPSPMSGLLNALDDTTLTDALAALDAAQLAEVIPALPTQRVATVLAAMAARNAASTTEREGAHD